MPLTYSAHPTKDTYARANGLKTIMGAFIIGAFAFVLGYQVATDGYRLRLDPTGLDVDKVATVQEHTDLDLTEFWRVLGLLEKNFINTDKLAENTLVDGAIKGMVAALDDPYTYYLTDAETDSFQDGLDGVYEGIGVQLGYKEENLMIIAPLSGGPAEAAGVKPGDIIVAIEGESAASLNLGEVVQKVRGTEGTSVKLTLARKNAEGGLDPVEVTITRKKISAPNILATREDDGIVVLNILRFGTDIEGEWKQIVKEYDLKNAKGIVVDVRNNPGGYLNGAAVIASSFMKKGVVVSQEFADGEKNEYTNDKEGELLGKPVVALINESSASASEILAGALKQAAGAILVGTKSFGKNTVQEAYQLDDGASVHITAAHWLLPNGERIPDDGIVPDVAIEQGDTDDAQRDRALEILKEKM